MKNSAFIRLADESDDKYVDIYDTYGVSFLKGSYLALLKKSASKDFVENDSRLEHGVQMVAKPDYAKYSKRTVSVSIIMEANTSAQFSTRFETFQDKIMQGLFYLKIPSVNRVFKLVYSDLKIKQEYRGNFATFTLEMVEPNPQDRLSI